MDCSVNARLKLQKALAFYHLMHVVVYVRQQGTMEEFKTGSVAVVGV